MLVSSEHWGECSDFFAMCPPPPGPHDDVLVGMLGRVFLTVLSPPCRLAVWLEACGADVLCLPEHGFLMDIAV